MIWRELEKPVAFVLGGGGSLGAIQVGMLEALAEHAIVPDLVVGTSVGAINGAILAADPQGAAHRLAHSWLRLQNSCWSQNLRLPEASQPPLGETREEALGAARS
jgi:predicted acylesterase/phospholipase RssA